MEGSIVAVVARLKIVVVVVMIVSCCVGCVGVVQRKEYRLNGPNPKRELTCRKKSWIMCQRVYDTRPTKNIAKRRVEDRPDGYRVPRLR